MIDGDPESAHAVTHTSVKITQRNGTTTTKRVLVPLDAPASSSLLLEELIPDLSDIPYEMDNASPPPERQKPHRVFSCKIQK